MELEHTPGPWGLSSETPTIIKAFDAFGETNIIIGSASGYTGSPYFPSGETAAANARLMAAAPQLLEALRRTANSAGFQYMTYETQSVVNAAIAKAAGSAA
jgi:hypothetical protein